MADTITDLIAANIVTTLEGITVANGYEQEFSAVLRPGQVVRPESRLLGLLVWDGVTITEDDSAADYHMSADWVLTICIMDSDTLGTSPETACMKAGMDVVKALNADVTRGNYAYDTIFESIQPDPDEAEGRDYVQVRFSTPFRVSRADPYEQNEP